MTPRRAKVRFIRLSLVDSRFPLRWQAPVATEEELVQPVSIPRPSRSKTQEEEAAIKAAIEAIEQKIKVCPRFISLCVRVVLSSLNNRPGPPRQPAGR